MTKETDQKIHCKEIEREVIANMISIIPHPLTTKFSRFLRVAFRSAKDASARFFTERKTTFDLRSFRIASVALLTTLAISLVAVGEESNEVASKEQPRIATDGPEFEMISLCVDANEGIAAGDVDGDGKLDLVAGRNWYRGGDWSARPLRSIADWNGYIESNGDYLFDVDQDGHLDVIAGSFLPTQVHWYRNPGKEDLRLGKQWPQNLLVDTGASANEGQLMEDIDGDGRPEWIVNSWKKDVPMVVWRLADLPATSNSSKGNSAEKRAKGSKNAPPKTAYELKRHALGDAANGHGIGVGDISGDGKVDVLVGQGWYEQPANDPWGQPWTFHDDWLLHASLPMLIADVDQDGDNDVIFGNGHAYGLQWWENQGADADGKLKWDEHSIDRTFSQPHSMVWTDLNGDGQPDLITGKRYYAHNGRDPGGKEVPCLYWYQYDRETESFIKHIIDEGRVGTGLQIVAQDLDADGDTDLAVAGKSGTYVLLAKP